MKKQLFFLLIVHLGVTLLTNSTPVKSEVRPVEVLTGVRLLTVEKVDLSANSYKLDFYLWFSWNPIEIILQQIKDF
jgi:hypothetical protein